MIHRTTDHYPLTTEALQGDYEDIIGRSPQMVEVLKIIDKVSDTTAKVLIGGETGTGKELIAQALHRNSKRSQNEMVCINCTAVPEHLLESELFGHEKGAFTDAKTRHIGKFERAHNGTLFLDEIGDMPITLQAKLLRVVETGVIERLGGTQSISVDVRILAATHCNLKKAIKNSTFRADLYYRLNDIAIHLPALRERPVDIRGLAEHFVKKHCNTYDLPGRKIAPETLACLQGYPWPGNIRELENVLKSVVLLSDAEVILPGHLPAEILALRQPPREAPTPENRQTAYGPLGASLKTVETTFIRDTLTWQNGNQKKAAQILGISVRTLYNRLKAYEKAGLA